MGNSLCGNDDCSNHVRLGNHASIDTTREEDYIDDDGALREGWSVSYTAFRSRCILTLERVVHERGHVSEVFLELDDDMCFGGGFRVWIETAETDFLDVYYENDKKFRDMMLFKTNETSVVKTDVFCYGNGRKRGLVVVEQKKKKRGDKNPYTATVAHYYAVSSGHAFSQIDVGLSMVVKIRVLNNDLDYTVKGPDRHPSSALCYMFEQVSRTGSWNPMACPHCADADQGQWSESESGGESDEDESEDERNKVSPAAPIHGPRENRRLELINNKDINENGNGNRIGRDQKFKFSIPIHFGKKIYLSDHETESDGESEDSENESEDERNKVSPAAPIHGPRENRRPLINNKDVNMNGNGNGSIIGRDQKVNNFSFHCGTKT